MWSTLAPVLMGGALAAATSLGTLWLAGRHQDAVMANERSAQVARERRAEVKQIVLSVLAVAWEMKRVVTDEWELHLGGTLREARARAEDLWMQYSDLYPEVQLMLPPELRTAVFEFGSSSSLVSIALFHKDERQSWVSGTVFEGDDDFGQLFERYSDDYDELLLQSRSALERLLSAQGVSRRGRRAQDAEP